MMFDGKGYGPIDGMPAIVFHYPPIFHALAMAASETFGMDQLAAGRLVSLTATLAGGAVVACIVHHFARREHGRGTALLCAAAGGLVALAFVPVAVWSPLMRVDMVAFAFGLAGLWCGLIAIERPRMVLLAALFFVAAVYAKQTSLAAPAATFLILLLDRPRTALTGIAA
jgi:4-amino-4-deoxy-L-arabinose transferase-like glycosyltransferase